MNSAGDRSCGVGVLGNSHKFAYDIRMQIKTMLTIGCGVACLGATAIADDLYKFSNEIPIGGEGGWDYVTVDAAARRLYLSHATKVVVVDLTKNAIIGEIGDTPGVHGFVVAPELKRGFASNGKEWKASIVDLKTLRTISKIETGTNPDALVYEPVRGEVYFFNNSGNSATVVSAKTASVVSTIALGGSPEFAVADGAAGRVYCNIDNKSEVAAIDTTKHQVEVRWPLAHGPEQAGIAYERAHEEVFV